jgi:hypothetical protein
MIEPSKHDWVDIGRVKADFDDFLNEFGTPIYRRYFTSASTHTYYGTKTYGVSTTVSFTGAWRYVTAEDYRLIVAGRVAVGDAVAIVPSGVTDILKDDEWWIKGISDHFNVTWKQDNLIGSQIAFYEVGLAMGRGRR